ncbi:flagellar biosynthesis protein FlhF [Inconstantimicrobium mannanitabidum]|uniref:Flagellar biosynthesis regulator FlhF n=1 Tax=Inconstantimicrobium mannanitabidum TaxID=1604901 RepID=A0ACB5R8I4_9CLOT|nr:flagellar biosynthesis protein FlhF [Clostridium sp. TW13]GKX65504.1 flagellar biosynthesis regulator FlhF [Clostridium sp. TW13]
MLIKRYIVNNMNEAMTRIRYELGKDAIIISQRKIRKPGIKGFFSNKLIEVTAAIENSEKKSDEVEQLKINPLQSKVKEILENKNKELKETTNDVKEEPNLATELKDMKKMLENLSKGTSPLENEEESIIKEIEEFLEKNDFDAEVIDEILVEYKNNYSDTDALWIDCIKEILSKKIRLTTQSIEGAMVLVGPTGVGKTTTIAKLAGRLALIEKRKVGLITIDTYRIGAVEQLKTYAEIMNIPFKVVITIKEMEEAIEALKDCDVILVDTTGRSSKNQMQISELRAFISKVKTDNIHLVISATTKNKDISAITEGFRALNYKNTIITKLDETTVYGSIINIIYKAKTPVSFLTVGQNVPDDIAELSVDKLVKLSLGEDNIC